MKIGQLIKNILSELSKQPWKESHNRFIRQTTVPPEFMDCAEILINAGLFLNHSKGQYTNLYVFQDNKIYINLMCRDKLDDASLQLFFRDIEAAIDSFVRNLAFGWMETSKATLEFYQIPISEKHINAYGKEMIVVEHITLSEAYSTDNLLWYSAAFHGYKNHLNILYSKRNPDVPRRDFIIGKRNAVNWFIQNIPSELSPVNFTPEVPASPEETLQKRCAQALHGYSLFDPAFSLQALAKRATENQLRVIEEAYWQQVENYEELSPFRDKIFVYESTSRTSPPRLMEGYPIYPARPQLKVGMLDAIPCRFSDGNGFALNMFLPVDHCGISGGLTTSDLKYSNFRARLPSLEELDLIKEAIQGNCAKFSYPFIGAKALEKIAAQKREIEERAAKALIDYQKSCRDITRRA